MPAVCGRGCSRPGPSRRSYTAIPTHNQPRARDRAAACLSPRSASSARGSEARPASTPPRAVSAAQLAPECTAFSARTVMAASKDSITASPAYLAALDVSGSSSTVAAAVAGLAEAIAQLGSTAPRVFVWMGGNDNVSAEAHAGVTAGLLNTLAPLYDALAACAPRATAIPLTPAVGWTLESVAQMPGLSGLLMQSSAPSPSDTPSCSTASSSAPATNGTAFLASVNSFRHAAGLPPLEARHASSPRPSSAHPASAAEAVGDAAGAGPGSGYQTLLGQSCCPNDTPLQFSRVAVGGTFDRLHAGHELLLAATALVANQYIFVGVTSDALLAKKAHRELLQPYEQRAGAAESFLLSLRPPGQLSVQTGSLKDPKEPTMAELDPDMQALVVSMETLAGGEAINAGRAARGFPPLALVVVPVLGATRAGAGAGSQGGQGAGQQGGAKLSSSELREKDAQALAAVAAATASGACAASSGK